MNSRATLSRSRVRYPHLFNGKVLALSLDDVLSDLARLLPVDKAGLRPPPSVATADPSDEGVKEPSQVQ